MKLILIIILALFKAIQSDLPIHCTSQQIETLWLIYLDFQNIHQNYFENRCGHPIPGNEQLTYNQSLQYLKMISGNQMFKMEVELRPDGMLEILSATGLSQQISQQYGLKFEPMNQQYRWSMVYDRGFEIRFTNSFKIFFYSYYGQLDGGSRRLKQSGKNRRDDEERLKEQMKYDYYSDCGQTLTGWFSIWNNRNSVIQQYDLGCGYAYRKDRQKIYTIKQWVYALFLQNNQILYDQMNKEIQDSYEFSRKKLKRVLGQVRKQKQIGQKKLSYEQKYEVVNNLVNQINSNQSSFKLKTSQINIDKQYQDALKYYDYKKYIATRLKKYSRRLKKSYYLETVQIDQLLQANKIPKNYESCQQSIGAIQNQQDCGCCYAISFAYMINAQINKDLYSCDNLKELDVNKKNYDGQMSNAVDDFQADIKQMVVCNYYNQGCGGGNSQLIGKFGQELFLIQGVSNDIDYDSQCEEIDMKKIKRVVKISDYGYVSGIYSPHQPQILQMIKAIQKYQGVVVCIMAQDEMFSTYSEGIFDRSLILPDEFNSNSNINWSMVDHTLYVYGWGYNHKTNQYYWKVANSWGIQWGDNGRGFILMGKNVMGIESHVEWAQGYLVALDQQIKQDIKHQYSFLDSQQQKLKYK